MAVSTDHDTIAHPRRYLQKYGEIHRFSMQAVEAFNGRMRRLFFRKTTRDGIPETKPSTQMMMENAIILTACKASGIAHEVEHHRKYVMVRRHPAVSQATVNPRPVFAKPIRRAPTSEPTAQRAQGKRKRTA